MNREQAKDARAVLNAMADQFNATAANRLKALPLEQLADVALALGVDMDRIKDELIEEILNAL